MFNEGAKVYWPEIRFSSLKLSKMRQLPFSCMRALSLLNDWGLMPK